MSTSSSNNGIIAKAVGISVMGGTTGGAGAFVVLCRGQVTTPVVVLILVPFVIGALIAFPKILGPLLSGVIAKLPGWWKGGGSGPVA